MIPLAVPNISGNEGRYLQRCVDDGFVSSVGPFVTRFEQMCAEAAGAGHAAATSAGTTGLHVALAALGVGRDDLVLLPSFTFIASANAIMHSGAEPWLFDISTETWTLDPALVAAELARSTQRAGDRLIHSATGRRVAAIMPVYTLGMPADMQPLASIARQHGIALIADAAAALGARYHGQNLGGLADLSVCSFNGNKTVTAGGGGCVLGNDKALVDTVRHLSTTARVGTAYDHDRVGFNYRMTNLQAAVGCAQLERLDEFVAKKRAIAARYTRELSGLRGVRAFPAPAGFDSACWFSGICLGDNAARSVPELCEALRERGIEARTFWKAIHLQAPYRGCVRTAMPVSEDVWSRVLTLPCSTGLDDAQQAQVIAVLHELLG